MPHAKVLLHQGSGGIGGTAMDIAIQADDLRHTRDTVLGLIAADTGQPVDRVERDSARDRWFTAEAAKDYGFVDAVVGSLADVLPVRRRPAGLGSGR
jgi:ATP-dependent Clp protease protease subunit